MVASAATIKEEAKPDHPFFGLFHPRLAPKPYGLILQKGDRLAICGDSITEQKMYSRIMETYLTVCVPELEITARQYGWSGETAEGFLRRMTNDCLRFQPTIATTCYGMNDFKYRAYDEPNAQWYRERYTAVARAFKSVGARVVLGSPGCVDKIASWVKSANGTLEAQNLSLCAYRDIGIDIAAREKIRFADVFWPMYKAGFYGREQYGFSYTIAGKDGVHPGWAGHLVMAHSYLKAMGLDGSIGTLTVNLDKQTAQASSGHVVKGFTNGTLTVTSSRYPFCATGEINKDSSMRSGMSLVPFNQELNRFLLVVKKPAAKSYRVTWGTNTQVYAAAQLRAGVNLAADFAVNPFSAAFQKVDDAVAAKQNFETKQVKTVFHSKEAKADMASAVMKTELERDPLAAAIKTAFTPVTHTVTIEAQP
jgi:lysophospholipase L1-like esterase